MCWWLDHQTVKNECEFQLDFSKCKYFVSTLGKKNCWSVAPVYSGRTTAMRTAKGEHNFVPKPQQVLGQTSEKSAQLQIVYNSSFWESTERLHLILLQCSFCFHHQAGLKQLTWRLEQFLALFGPSGHVRTIKSNLYEPIMSPLYRKHPKTCFFFSKAGCQ